MVTELVNLILSSTETNHLKAKETTLFTTNSDFTIPISLQPNVVDKGLYNKVAKAYMG